MRTTLFVIMLSLWTGSSIAQQIYKTVDENGRVTYTDKPPADAKQRQEAELPPVNSVPEERVSNRQRTNDRNQNPDDSIRYEVNILNPAPEAHVTPGQRDLSISVALDQELREGHFLAFYLNDSLLTETRERQFVVQEITRGTHQIQVEVLNSQGALVGASEPVVIYVHRPSVINRPGS